MGNDPSELAKLPKLSTGLIQSICGLSCGYYRLGRKQIAPSISNYRDLQFLIYLASGEIGSFLRNRELLVKLPVRLPVPLLTHILRFSRDDDLRWLCVWILGRTSGSVGTAEITELVQSDSWPIRKESVKALKRKSAWLELRDICDSETDERIVRLAQQTPPRKFHDRVSRFLGRGCHSAQPIEDDSKPAFFSVPISPDQARPPKPAWLIRAILERIRRVLSSSLPAI